MKPKKKKKIIGAAAIATSLAALTAGAIYAKKKGLDKKAIKKFKDLQKKAKKEYTKVEKKIAKEYNELLDKVEKNVKKKQKKYIYKIRYIKIAGFLLQIKKAR